MRRYVRLFEYESESLDKCPEWWLRLSWVLSSLETPYLSHLISTYCRTCQKKKKKGWLVHLTCRTNCTFKWSCIIILFKWKLVLRGFVRLHSLLKHVSTSPPTVHEDSLFSTPSPTFTPVCFITDRLTGVRCYLPVLICFSPIATFAEHLFMSL